MIYILDIMKAVVKAGFAKLVTMISRICFNGKLNKMNLIKYV